MAMANAFNGRFLLSSLVAGWLAAHGAFAQEPPVPTADFAGNIEEMCRLIVGEQTEFMEQCRQEETAAASFIYGWLDYNGLLTPEGAIDALQLIRSQTDPLSALQQTPASVTAFCLETTRDWIGLQECLLVMDRNPAMRELPPDYGQY